MRQYKHYSFDLWLTLIRSNPLYKRQRSKYFFEHFNPKKKTEEEVFIIIRDIEKMVDSVNQTTGYSIHCIEIVSMIIHNLEYDLSNLGLNDMLAIMHMMQQQFLACLPTLYDKDTAGVLHYLKSEGSNISILSNTAFIVGETLDVVLDMLGIKKYISFCLFSDQVGFSKPNQQIFTLLTMNAFTCSNAKRSDILHVGDNPLADIKGAELAGISSFQINSNSKSIKHLLT